MSSGTITNAMTVDVEDYFQVSAFERHIDKQQWHEQPIRVEENTRRLLALFSDCNVKATFFTLGWVAERFPELVRDIAAQGHEVASHGYDHTRVTEQTPDSFREDVRMTREILQDITGSEVTGYRAASFSINKNNLWAHQILAEEGYRYSSSIYPIHLDLYGIPDAPRFPFIMGDSGVLEVPVTTMSLFGQNFPAGGGGYFRLMPYFLYRWLLGRVNRWEHREGIFYFHPWEIDPQQPRQEKLGLKTSFRHYTNLATMFDRIERLLGDFSWGRMDQVFLPQVDSASKWECN